MTNYHDTNSAKKIMNLADAHPLDFSIQYPPRREYFKDNFRGDLSGVDVAAEEELLLYLHIPFCHAKCYFCNFAVDVRKTPEIHENYVQALIRQMDMAQDLVGANTIIPGIDIGGGTPTLIQTEQLVRIMQALKPWMARSSVDNPVSIETTPAIAAEQMEKMQALYENGVSRISMGIQSTNDEFLGSVNRSAQIDMNLKAIHNLKDAGFERINADLIFALPGQSAEHWEQDLDFIIESGVDSVTTYDCLYRGKGRALTKRTEKLPTQDVYGTLYDIAYHKLKEAGFHAAYGSVNFSRHAGETGTSPYFEGRLLKHIPYIGLGNYSSSQIGNNWWFAPHGVDQWQKQVNDGNALPFQDAYTLPPSELLAKQILLSFNYGYLEPERINARFGINFEEAYGDVLALAQSEGLLERDGANYRVVEGQFKNMPKIRSLFYTPGAFDWLVSQQDRPQVKFLNASSDVAERGQELKTPAPQEKPSKNGLVIGKFMPPHAGHDYLVNEASKKTDKLVVLMMARESDPVPGDLRANWFKAVHPEKDIRLVKHDLPTDYNDPQVWQRWIEKIREALDGAEIDTVFSSEDYGRELAERLGAKAVMIDQERKAVPISATQIRANPKDTAHYLSSDAARDWMLNEFGQG